MGFNQDVDEVAAAAKTAKSGFTRYLVAFLAGAVAMLIVMGLIKIL
jgi:hypothetical protein